MTKTTTALLLLELALLPCLVQAASASRVPVPEPVAPNAWAASQRGERSKGEVIQVYRLKYASAADRTITVGDSSYTVPGVASLLRDLFANSASGAQRQGGGGRSVEWPSGAGGPVDVPPRMDEGLMLPQIPGAPTDSNVGVVADPARNAVLIRDKQGRVAVYQRMIQALDIPQRVVEVQVQVVDAMPSGSGASNGASNGSLRAWVVAEYRVVTLENIEAHIVDTQLTSTVFGPTSNLRMAILPRILGGRSDTAYFNPSPGIELAITIQSNAAPTASVPAPPPARQGLSNVSVVQEGQTLLLAGMSNGVASSQSSLPSSLRPPGAGGTLEKAKPEYIFSARANNRERLYLITPRLLAP